MITNKKQYRATQEALKRFEAALAQGEDEERGENPIAQEVMTEGITLWQYKVMNLEELLEEFDHPLGNTESALSFQGKDGWELIEITKSAFYFKRPLWYGKPYK